jgi:hypothetical protein
LVLLGNLGRGRKENVDVIRAALRIAARVMEPGAMEKILRVVMLGEENAGVAPSEYEKQAANIVRSALTKPD